AMSLATLGVEPRDSGVASAMVNTSQQVGGAIGTALLNTIAASATTAYVADHIGGAAGPSQQQLVRMQGLVQGYTSAIWFAVGIGPARAGEGPMTDSWSDPEADALGGAARDGAAKEEAAVPVVMHWRDATPEPRGAGPEGGGPEASARRRGPEASARRRGPER